MGSLARHGRESWTNLRVSGYWSLCITSTGSLGLCTCWLLPSFFHLMSLGPHDSLCAPHTLAAALLPWTLLRSQHISLTGYHAALHTVALSQDGAQRTSGHLPQRLKGQENAWEDHSLGFVACSACPALTEDSSSLLKAKSWLDPSSRGHLPHAACKQLLVSWRAK